MQLYIKYHQFWKKAINIQVNKVDAFCFKGIPFIEKDDYYKQVLD